MPELTGGWWSESWLWLGGSLLAAILWSNLTHHFRQPRSGPIGEFVAHVATWRYAPWVLQSLRLLYYVGVPFAALYWGHDAVVRRHLGLPGDQPDPWLDWARDVGWASALGVGAFVLLAVWWRTYRRALATVAQESPAATEDDRGWAVLREAAYHEIHWAFYRSAPVVLWGSYWGIWAGLALVALEAILNPAWRKGLADPPQTSAQLTRIALAVISSVLFVKAENLWLAMVLHWAVSWCVATVTRTFPLSHLKSTQAPPQSAPPTLPQQ